MLGGRTNGEKKGGPRRMDSGLAGRTALTSRKKSHRCGTKIISRYFARTCRCFARIVQNFIDYPISVQKLGIFGGDLNVK